eukprot:gene3348-3836_t
MIEFFVGIALSFTAVCLNITEAIFLLKQKARRSNYQNVIFSLSIADIFAGIFFTVRYVVKYYHEKHTDGKNHETDTVIAITEETLGFSITSSLLHVIAISFDRLLATRFPIKHRLWYTNKKNRWLIIVVWTLSFILLLPSILTYLLLRKMHILNIIISWLVLAGGCLMAVLYAYIVRRTVSKACMIEIITLQSGKREVISACSPREKRILFVSISIVASFVVCSFPCAIRYIIKQNYNALILLLLANSIINPVIYFFQRRFQDQRNETMKQRTAKNTENSEATKTAQPQNKDMAITTV